MERFGVERRRNRNERLNCSFEWFVQSIRFDRVRVESEMGVGREMRDGLDWIGLDWIGRSGAVGNGDARGMAMVMEEEVRVR